MEIVPFAGWSRNARLTSGDTEMIVTLDVGPRIISYGRMGGANLMAVHPSTAGKTGGNEFVSYGGHRLWIAPELDPRTFQPDNGPVDYQMDGDWHVFTIPADSFRLVKEFRILPDAGRFVVDHRIYNHGGYPLELAPWTPTQFAPGGQCLFPQPTFIPHSEKVLPARPLTLWHYTNMSDPRWTWGERVARLTWMDRPPTKCGTFVEQGIVAFSLGGLLHVRRFEARVDAKYPDFGCNFETFTRPDMLEVETLGPLQAIEPGAFCEHREVWYLVANQVPPESDLECGDWLAELAASMPFS